MLETVKKNSKYTILTPNGFEPFYGVNKLQDRKTLTIILANGAKIDCTHDHKLFSEKCDGWIESRNLYEGDSIQTKTGFVKITKIFSNLHKTDVYDIINSGKNHQYYSNDILSHNCEFIGSSHTLIHPLKLREMVWQQPTKDRFGLDIQEMPDPRKLYICVFDVSEGVGGDYSALSIFDVTQYPYKQVAKYRSKDVSPLMFPDVIYRFARMYNNAWVLGETNNIGQQVVQSLYIDLEYENVIATFTKNKNIKVGGGFSSRSAFGVRTTKAVKKIGCSNLKTIIESNKLIISDFETIEELTTFVETKDTYKAEEGCHDDLAMTLVLFGWLVTQPYFKDLTNSDVRRSLSNETLQGVHEDLLPAGFIDDGIDVQSVEHDRRRRLDWDLSDV